MADAGEDAKRRLGNLAVDQRRARTFPIAGDVTPPSAFQPQVVAFARRVALRYEPAEHERRRRALIATLWKGAP